jgi:hypothetical protein
VPFARDVFPNLEDICRFLGFAQAKSGAGAYLAHGSTITMPSLCANRLAILLFPSAALTSSQVFQKQGGSEGAREIVLLSVVLYSSRR